MTPAPVVRVRSSSGVMGRRNMKRSLQEIENHFIQQGFRGKRLEAKLGKDQEYLKLLKQRKNNLKSSLQVKTVDRKRYVLSINEDLEILDRIYKLESKRLSEIDKKIVKLIRTQLEHDWRRPL